MKPVSLDSCYPGMFMFYCCSVTQACPTFCDPMDYSIPGFPVLYHLTELDQTHIHWVGDANHLILCCPLLLLPSIFPRIRVFSNELTLHFSWPNYWSLSFSTSPFDEYSRLFSFRIGWFDLLSVQGNSLLQHSNAKASILQHSAFFMVLLSHPHMTTGKTITLTRWTFVGKEISLLFNMLSRFVMF